MKYLIELLLVLLSGTYLLAQTPQGISHQAVIRNAQGELVTDQNIGVQVSILQGSEEGTAVFVETHELVSNHHGLITYTIGQGNQVSGNFSDIEWADGPYFLKTEADATGGSDYTIVGISQFLSVPHALHAQTSSDAFDGDMENQRIINLADPVGDKDLSTKAYVDLLEARIQALENEFGVPTEEITVGPEGGTFQVDENMSITFSAGAVETVTTFFVNRLLESQWENVFDDYGEHNVEIMQGFRILPEDIEFNDWVTVHYTSLSSTPGTVPLAHIVKTTQNKHSLTEYKAEVQHEDGWLWVAILSTGEFLVEANPFLVSQQREKDETSCRDKWIKVKADDFLHQESSTDCHVIASTVEVQFLDCPGQPTEIATLREISGGCEGWLELTTVSVMPTESESMVTVKTGVSVLTLENQTVSLSNIGGGQGTGIQPTTVTTDATGSAQATLTSGAEEGMAIVIAEADLTFPLFEVIIDGVTEEYYPADREVRESKEVLIKKDSIHWYVNLNVELTSGDPEIHGAKVFWHIFGLLGGGLHNVDYTIQLQGKISFSVDDFTGPNLQGVFMATGSQSLDNINLIPVEGETIEILGQNVPVNFPAELHVNYIIEETDSFPGLKAGNIYFLFLPHGFLPKKEEGFFGSWDLKSTITDDDGATYICSWTFGTAIFGKILMLDPFDAENFNFPSFNENFSESGMAMDICVDGVYFGTYTLNVTQNEVKKQAASFNFEND